MVKTRKQTARDADAQHAYVFAGRTPALSEVTGDTVYTATYTEILWGDANGDGTIDTRDVTLIRRYLANFDYDTNTSTVDIELGADANGDGAIDTRDVTLIRRYLANYDYDSGTSTVALGPQP